MRRKSNRRRKSNVQYKRSFVRRIPYRIPIIRSAVRTRDVVRDVRTHRKQLARYRLLNKKRTRIGNRPLKIPKYLTAYELTFNNALRYSKCELNKQIRRRLAFRKIGRGGNIKKRTKNRSC